MTTLLLTNPAGLQHLTPAGHPERPDRLRAGQQAILAVIEADDPVDALDAHIECAAVLGNRLGVVPAARREGASIGAEHRPISASAMPVGRVPS